MQFTFTVADEDVDIIKEAYLATYTNSKIDPDDPDLIPQFIRDKVVLGIQILVRNYRVKKARDEAAEKAAAIPPPDVLVNDQKEVIEGSVVNE